jgi:tetratricopeptide (TPR) repeat protein
LLREKAVSGLEPVAEPRNTEVVAHLKNLLDDSSRNVRVAAAWMLKDSLDLQIPAAREIQAQLAFDSDQPLGQYRIAEFDLARQNPTNALARLEKAIAWDPFAPKFRSRTAEVCSTLGRTNEAIEQWQAACRLKPTSAEYELQLGLAQVEGHQIDAAITAFRESLKLQPEQPQGWYNLGLAESVDGHVDDGIQSILHAESLDPNDPQLPYARASILSRAGRKQEARLATEQSLKIQPDFQPAQTLLQELSRGAR